MTVSQPPPKRIAYNQRLLQQILVKEKYFSQYPRVSEQVECFPLQTEKLFKHGYNPAINEKGWMVYRFHKAGLASTKLARAILGKDGAVFSNHELLISGGAVGEDDAKLFTFQGDQYLSWVESEWQTDIPRSCVVKYAKFNDGKLSDFQWPKHLPNNDGKGWCKNLVFFEHDGQLMVIFQCHPTHRIYNLTKPDSGPYETEGAKWPYGEIRGGTPPLPYEDKFLRFFHSRINNDLGAVPWRYFIGAMLINPEPPFEVLAVIKKPLVYGSEVGTVKKKECYHWKSKVVFASGAIPCDGGFLLSVGENDSASLLCRIKYEDLKL